MDNPPPAAQFTPMSMPPATAPAAVKHTTPASLVVDFVLVLGFFTLMFFVLRPHVMSDNPRYINLWAALASSCMSGVFWLAVQMFRVVLRSQLAAKKQG